MSKNFNILIDKIDQLVKSERFGAENHRDIKKALKKLSHALDVKDIKRVRKAIDELSRELLR